jgi:hypothetical protein
MAFTRKRRRLLIATVVALILIGGWWLTRPKIDPRFVGKWIDENPIFDGYWHFRADGTGEIRASHAPAAASFCWSCDGEEIVCVEPGITQFVPDGACRWFRKKFGVRIDGFRTRERVAIPEPGVLWIKTISDEPGLNRYVRIGD